MSSAFRERPLGVVMAAHVAVRSSRAVRSSVTSARFDPLLDYEAWHELGAKLRVYGNATQWWLGDWLVFGRMKYGCRYKDAIAATRLDYQTLRNYAMVARRFEASRRRANLTFQHHATVCALTNDEQDRWLDRAATEGWSRNELRRRLRAESAAATTAEQVFRLVVARGRAQLWREAAERSRCGCDAWMVRVLDEAAAAPIHSGASTEPNRLMPVDARAA
jgi:hypothetical protein